MRYGVYTWRVGKGPVTNFTVSAAGNAASEKLDEELVVFNVHGRQDEESQKQRAHEYKDYLNLLEEAKEEAAKNVTLVTAMAKRLGES